MTVESKLTLDRDYITHVSKKHDEPAWLLQLRLDGIAQAEALPLPTLEKTKIDHWNILSSPKETESKRMTLDELPEEVSSIIGRGEQAGNLLIHKNGNVVYSSLQQELQDQGVIFTDMHTAIKKHGDLVQKYLHTLVKQDEHKLSALHSALFHCGVFLYIPKHVEVKVPVQSLFWEDQDSTGMVPHILIVAEDNSKVTYVENSFGRESMESVNNYVAEVFVGPNAQVTFAAVDYLGEQTTNYIYRRAIVERDGQIEWALGQMNDGHTVSDNTTILKGNGSRGDTKSVVVGVGEQSLNFVQRMDQIGLATDGQMLSHAVMKDSSRAIFNGITKIEKGATKSNGEQTERVLMLNDKARGDANPILLIDEDDVTAGHAASVGQINQNQLYYLMSRGISRAEAERLIIIGFLNPVVSNIPLEGLRKRLVEVIERKIKA